MAIYGFDIQPISRLQGGSVSKTAAYILRANIYDAYLGETHYYGYSNDLLHSEIILPDYAPQSFHELNTLLTAIDCAEKDTMPELAAWSGLPCPMIRNLPTRNDLHWRGPL